MSFISSGPLAVRKRRDRIFLSLLSISLIGIILKIWQPTVYNSHLEHALETIEEITVHMFAAAWLYLALDYAFHNVSQWYGKEDKYGSDGFINDLRSFNKKQAQKYKEIIVVNTFLEVFAPPLKKKGESESEFQETKKVYQSKKERFKNGLKDVINNKGANVKILLLDPFSFSAKQRQEEFNEELKRRVNKYDIFENEVAYNVVQEIIRSINFCADIYIKNYENQEALEIKLYDRIPPFSLFKINGNYNLGFYPGNSTTTKGKYWQFYEDSEFAKFIMAKFTDLWGGEEIDKLNNYHQQKEISYSNTFTLKEYLQLSFYDPHYHQPHQEFKNLLYIDLYNKKTGFINEERVLAIYRSPQSNDSFNQWILAEKQFFVKYKNQELQVINVTFQSALEVLIHELDLVENISMLKSYCKSLVKLKYPEQYLNTNELDYEKPYFFKVQNINISILAHE